MVPAPAGQYTPADWASCTTTIHKTASIFAALLGDLGHLRAFHLSAPGGPVPTPGRPAHPFIRKPAETRIVPADMGRILDRLQPRARDAHGGVPPGRHRAGAGLHEQAAGRHTGNLVEDVHAAHLAAERQERGAADARRHGHAWGGVARGTGGDRDVRCAGGPEEPGVPEGEERDVPDRAPLGYVAGPVPA